MGQLYKRRQHISESQTYMRTTRMHRVCHHPRTMPFGTSQPHEGFLCVAKQGDAALGKVEKQVGKNDEIVTSHTTPLQ